MNINSFFLDKLSAGDATRDSGLNKVSPGAYLFSDIMKIYESETASIGNNQSTTIRLAEEILPSSENVIDTTQAEFEKLSQYIDWFVTNSLQPVKISNSTYDIQPALINKKQFLLSSNGLEDFIKGLVQSIEAGNDLNLKSGSENKPSNKFEVGSTSNEEVVIQSLLNFFVNNKSLNFSFKNGSEKIKINLYELPEENIETKLDLDKLTADFTRIDIRSNAAIFGSIVKTGAAEQKMDSIQPPPSEETSADNVVLPKNIQPIFSNRTEQFQLVEPGNNVYKTEVIEIVLKQNNMPAENAAAPFVNLSNVIKDDLSLFQSFPEGPKDSLRRIAIQQEKMETAKQNTGSSSAFPEDEIIINENVASQQKISTNLQNEKPEIFELTKYFEQKAVNRSVGEVKNIVQPKPQLSFTGTAEVFSKPEVVFLKSTINQKTVENKSADDQKITLTTNTETKTVRQAELIKAKAQLEELKNIFTSEQISSKSNTKDDKTKFISDTKSVFDENSRSDKLTVGETQNKTSDKNFSKQKSTENFPQADGFLKNILEQNINRAIDFAGDKIKAAPETKVFQETAKIIKTTEILPEFTKIIQSGEKQSITFQLTPENLGKVKLVVDLVENQINTRIEVENEQIKQFVQSNIDGLKETLRSSGIQLNNVNVSLTNQEQKFSKAFGTRKKTGERISEIEKEKEQTHHPQRLMGYNTYEFLA
ncbi:MAG: flagellar hook-length control protein FliK [Bacteroidota bacterium]